MRHTSAAALALAVLTVVSHTRAHAQVALAALAPQLPDGLRTELTVDGRPLVGEFVRATADGVALWRYDTGATEESAAARVSKVVYDDSLLNGTLIGAVAGGVPGLIAGLAYQAVGTDGHGRSEPGSSLADGARDHRVLRSCAPGRSRSTIRR